MDMKYFFRLGRLVNAIYYLPGITLSNSQILSHLVLTTALEKRFCNYYHFTDVETEAKRRKVIWPHLHSRWQRKDLISRMYTLDHYTSLTPIKKKLAS